MAPVQHFRSVFHGFNRKDVVQYIEYLNNQHKAQIDQLNNQLLSARENSDSALQARLDEALARCEVVACGEGAVEIRSLQAEGGKRMAAPDYFRGHPLVL